MATIGNVVISVFASTKGLKKSLESGQKRIKRFAKNAVKTLKKIGVAVGVGIAGAIAASIAVVNSYAEKIDKLAKTSGKLGVTVAALQKLQYQAELTGVSSDTLNMALQRMVRGVSEAAQGTGEAKNALKELGIDAKKLAQLSPDEQFYRLSNAMKSISGQGDKVRLAMKLFDSEGVALVNTMNGNLNQMGDEFDSLGIKVSQSQARMVEAYQDAKTKLGSIFSGFGIQLTAQLSAPFTKLLEWITRAIKKMGGMDKAAGLVAKFVINSIASMIEAIGGLVNALRSVKLWLLNVKLAAQEAAKSLTFMNALEAGINVFNKDFKINIFGDTSKTKRDIESLESSMENTNNFADAAKKKADELRKLIGTGSDGGAIKKSSDAHYKAAEAVTSLATAAKKASSSISPAQSQNTNNVVNLSDYAGRYAANRRNLNIGKTGNLSSFSGENSPGIFQTETINKANLEHLNNIIAIGKDFRRMQENNLKNAPAFSGSGSGFINGKKVSLGADSASFGGKTYKGEALDKLLNSKPTTKITLEMVTDTEKVTGEVIGSQEFINAVSKLQNQKVQKEARQAAL